MPPSWRLVIEACYVVRRDGLNAERARLLLSRGPVLGDVNQLARPLAPSIAGGRAGVEGLHRRALRRAASALAYGGFG